MKKTLIIALGLSAYVTESSLMSFNVQPSKIISSNNENIFSTTSQGLVVSRQNYHMGNTQGNLRKVDASKQNSNNKTASQKSINSQCSKDSKKLSGSKSVKSSSSLGKEKSLIKNLPVNPLIASPINTKTIQQVPVSQVVNPSYQSQFGSIPVNQVVNSPYQSLGMTQSYAPSGQFYNTQYQVPQNTIQSVSQWTVSPQQLQYSQPNILSQNLLNQAVSFQQSQPFYTIQVPQISFQYSGYPSKNIQDQLNSYGNQKVQQQTSINVNNDSNQIQKTPEKNKSRSSSKNNLSSSKSRSKLIKEKSCDKNQLEKSTEKKSNISKDVKKSSQKRQVSTKKKPTIQVNKQSAVKAN